MVDGFPVRLVQVQPAKQLYSDASASPMDGFGVPGLNSGPGVVGPPTTGGLAGIDFGGTGGFTPFGDGLNIGRCNCPLTESEQQVQFVSNWTNTRATTHSSSAQTSAMP